MAEASILTLNLRCSRFTFSPFFPTIREWYFFGTCTTKFGDESDNIFVGGEDLDDENEEEAPIFGELENPTFAEEEAVTFEEDPY